MRSDISWFADRATTTWSVQPGRSFILIVPAGCDMDGAAADVKRWCADNMQPPLEGHNKRPAFISLAVDNVSSSHHFVHRVGKQLNAINADVSNGVDEHYPADQLAELVENANDCGLHPVIIINRFHAFARIADDHLLSVLSTMRTLENDGLLTTLALSPMRYQALRRKLSQAGHYPFVNSAYGDNHDEVGLTPMSREDFVHAAKLAGLSNPDAHRLYSYAGGPDEVNKALIACGSAGLNGVVERAAALLGDRLESFFDNAIDPELPERDELRVRLATGQVQPSQEDYLESSEGAPFLVRRTAGSRLVAASPVLSRLLLRGRGGTWRRYDQVLEQLNVKNYAGAAEMVSLLDHRTPHLEVFAKFVMMLRAVHAAKKPGLLGIDWPSLQQIGSSLDLDDPLVSPHSDWILTLVDWSSRVRRSVDPSVSPHVRLDVLLRNAADQEVQRLFVFMISTFLSKCASSDSPAQRIRDAAVIPESILQALAYSLGIDIRSAPERLPAVDFQPFFGRKEPFESPAPGQRIAMSHLLVIVPAILADTWTKKEALPSLLDPTKVVPLHQKLVDRFKNAASHTYSDATEDDASFFYSLCGGWLEDLKAIWNLDCAAGREVEPPQPTPDHLAQLLFGEPPNTPPDCLEAECAG
ncbi:hypothetical protein GRI40_07875 [Altererythrobacter aerius]|uniref:Novel STAND NTPase 2 domain-containing protein n=1 Tax=Tsuneonella aeria TaxID=1837929 RepID=A0A6I4TD24_9SPHN|nr:hypothetical protein [Tsuneonella aeria]MXO75132.1 hypothetical protein [Tsuneonella aeria]